MKKTSLFVLYLTFFLITLYAQTTLNFKDPEATKILQSLSQKIKNSGSVKLTFVLKMETYNGKLKMTNEKKGKVWMKQNKYKIEFENQQIISNGEIVWNYDQSLQEVQITQADNSNKIITPQKLLGSFYENDFYYKISNNPTTTNQIEIELVPIDKNKPFFKVYLVVEKNKKDFDVNYIKIYEKNGSRYTYYLSKLVPNKKIDDNFFIFDKSKFPKVEVVDLR